MPEPGHPELSLHRIKHEGTIYNQADKQVNDDKIGQV